MSCEAANLPCFESAKEAAVFMDRLYPVSGWQGAIVQCEACEQWHVLTGRQAEEYSAKVKAETPTASQGRLIVLTAAEIAESFHHGKLINDISEAKGLVSRNVSFNTDQYIHVVGKFGERAAHKLLGIPYVFNEGTFRAADLPFNIEVKTRTKDWHDCKIPPELDDSRRVVMAVVTDFYKPIRMVGWIRAGEGKKYPKIDPNGKGQPFHAVPQSKLWSIESLFTEIGQ